KRMLFIARILPSGRACRRRAAPEYVPALPFRLKAIRASPFSTNRLIDLANLRVRALLPDRRNAFARHGEQAAWIAGGDDERMAGPDRQEDVELGRQRIGLVRDWQRIRLPAGRQFGHG